MSDKMRWRYGDTNPVIAAVEGDTVIEIGDLVWQDVDDAKPACRQANQQEPCSQASFAARFLGVAMQRSRWGETNPIRVATTGVFEFDCQPLVVELGEHVGVALGPEVLASQAVCPSPYAIGRIARREASPVISVLVDIRSTVMTGGVIPSIPSHRDTITSAQAEDGDAPEPAPGRAPNGATEACPAPEVACSTEGSA
jgi:hypothetical protein